MRALDVVTALCCLFSLALWVDVVLVRCRTKAIWQRSSFRRGWWRGLKVGRRGAHRDEKRWRDRWERVRLARTVEELDALAWESQQELEQLEASAVRARARLDRHRREMGPRWQRKREKRS